MLRILLFYTFSSIILFGCAENKKQADEAGVDSASDSFHMVPKVVQHYSSSCAECHGVKMDAFADREWVHGSTREDLFKGIKSGYPSAGMPAFDSAYLDEEIYELTDYIMTGIDNRKRYDFTEKPTATESFPSETFNIKLDTIVKDMKSPWGMAFLPDGGMLVTEKSGQLYKVDKERLRVLVTGTPAVSDAGQGGMLDVVLHPGFASNQLMYISYSGIKKEGADELATTVIMRAKLEGSRLVDKKIIFEALPYSKTRHHYGCRMVFGRDGLLYFSVGDRGNEKENPQSTNNDLGKIHRVKDDGSIPADNPLINNPDAKQSIYTWGNRNPQGLTIHPVTGAVWANEHGPRGGDEINSIEKGKNYGWPVISYGINYNNAVITNKTTQEGMEQPFHYWLPSIGPSGMAFVTGDKYKGWEGDLLVGSLRFKYLNRSKMKDGKITGEELLLKNIGRVRDVRMSPGGDIYIAVEFPGYIFKLVPVQK